MTTSQYGFPSDGTLLQTNPVEIPLTIRSMFKRSLDADSYFRFEHSRLYDIVYASAGLRIHGYMAIPPAERGKMPALIFNRGGAGKRGALNSTTAAANLMLYASWGYIALASNYRGQGGSEGEEEWGAGDVDDALNLVPLIYSLGYADTERIGLVGGSRGGMMALIMLARNDMFKAAVTFGAPTDFLRADNAAYIRNVMSHYLPENADFDEEAGKRSATQWAEKLCKTTPLLLLHGTGDRRVDPSHALLLAMELQRTLHPYRLVMYENADHVLAGRRAESNAEIRSWLDMYVRHRATLPRVGPHGA